jgi:hypothetical protein
MDMVGMDMVDMDVDMDMEDMDMDMDMDMEGLPCAYHAQSVEYMEYMEGLAKNLPRVLYVHGAGQEVIQFE